MKNKIKKELFNYQKLYSVVKKIYSCGKLIGIYVRFVISIPLLLIPLQNKKIVVCNYFGKGYGDNGKYIVEEIIKQEHNYDIVWLLNKDLIGKVDFPAMVRSVKYGSLRALYELATAKVWIDNCRKSFYPLKRKEQFYIQTWHGGIAMKRIENDVKKNLSKAYLKSAKLDSKIANLFISNSSFCTDMYKRAFCYESKILEFGTPRCDVLFKDRKELHEKVRKFFNIDFSTKILIYAPTFRADGNLKVYDIDFNGLIEVLNVKFGGNWNVLVRLHPNISEQANFMKYNSKIINATLYDDMYELLSVSDILVTDYSSTMFEFSLTYKPVFLYAVDLEAYKEDRDFYFDIFSLPFSLACNNQELLINIKKFDKKKYYEQLKTFHLELGLAENGDASEKVVEVIHKEINNQSL
jgi:CDP-glycerol glycerophosphotransferase